MTQSELINSLWHRRKTEHLSSVDVDMYYFFLHCIFDLKASNPFTISNDWMARFLSIDRSTVYRSCKKLQELGLIKKLRLKQLIKFPLLHWCNNGNAKITAKKNNNEFFLYVYDIESVKSFSEIDEIRTKVMFEYSVVAPVQQRKYENENIENERFLYSKRLTNNCKDLRDNFAVFSRARTRGRKICISNNTVFDCNRSIYSKEKREFQYHIEDNVILKYPKKEKTFLKDSNPLNFSITFSTQQLPSTLTKFGTSEGTVTNYSEPEFTVMETCYSEVASQEIGISAINNPLQARSAQEKELGCGATAVIATVHKQSTVSKKEIQKSESKTSWKEYDDISTPAQKKSATSFARWFITLLPESIQKKVTISIYKGWMVAYDRLIRLDNHSPKEIFNVCKFGREDEFWKNNFYSPCKLRERSRKDKILYWDMIQLAMKEKQNVNPTEEQIDKRDADRRAAAGI